MLSSLFLAGSRGVQTVAPELPVPRSPRAKRTSSPINEKCVTKDLIASNRCGIKGGGRSVFMEKFYFWEPL